MLGRQRKPEIFFCAVLICLALISLITWRAARHPRIVEEQFKTNIQHFKTVLWHPPTAYVNFRLFSRQINLFQNCSFKNCQVTNDTNRASTSSAIIHNWFKGWRFANFSRPRDQVWIMWQQEGLSTYKRKKPSIKSYGKDGFNWTMGFRRLSDIYLPFGELIKWTNNFNKNYTHIAMSKSKDALWIVSHCNTDSQRELYVKELQKYITVDVLGKCGERWTCGKRHDYHDDCFDIMNNTYRFYLAFENALCDDFYTEKFFENYKYDLIQVVRTGKKASHVIPRDSYIYAGDFASAKDLGMYLKDIGKDVNKYAALLQQKDQYMSIPYQDLFSRAFCELCERLNSLDRYRSIYKDMLLWLTNKTPTECYIPEMGTRW